MEIYRKNQDVVSEAEAVALLEAQDDFSNNFAPGKVPPRLGAELLRIWNGGEHLDWEWNEETQYEYDTRTASEEAEAAELAFYQNPANLEDWKDVKIRPWRDQKLSEWVDNPPHKDLLFDYANWTQNQHDERAAIRTTLCDWPGTFAAWVSDTAIDAAKPAAPSYIT